MAKKTVLKIKVTKKDILEGQGGDEQYCAIALAAQRALKDAGFEDTEVSVDGESIALSGERPEGKYMSCTLDAIIKTPKSAATFIRKFDDVKEEQYDEEKDELFFLSDAEVLKKIKPIELEIAL